MKKNLALGEGLTNHISLNLLALKTLRDSTLDVIKQLKVLEKALENEHHATVEVVKDEIGRTQDDIKALLSGVYNEYWDLQNQLTPYGLTMKENEKMVGTQRERLNARS